VKKAHGARHILRSFPRKREYRAKLQRPNF
jgi:hypothetical protein